MFALADVLFACVLVDLGFAPDGLVLVVADGLVLVVDDGLDLVVALGAFGALTGAVFGAFAPILV